MKYLLLALFLVACNPKEGEVSQPSQDAPRCDLVLKKIWTSLADNETHDFRNLDFSFLYVPYSYIGSHGGNCSQQMKWFMIAPQVNGASFEFHLTGNPGAPCYDGDFYIRLKCPNIEICNSTFTSCKTFQ